MASTHPGHELISHGWSQGCLFPAVGHAFYERDDDGTWRLRSEPPTTPDENLIMATQACDILSTREPFLEALPCSWIPKGAAPYNGAIRGNSGRYFLVRKEKDGDGNEGALIVSATRIVEVSKASLVGMVPELPIDREAMPHFIRRFGAWLGGRYSRPALDREIVEAVQKPIVSALDSLPSDDDAYAALELVREARMFPLQGSPPYSVDLIVLLQSGVSSADTRVAAFRGTLEEAINRTAGGSRLNNCWAFTAEELSVSEYERTIKIPLDHYTLLGEKIHGAEPVRGLDHG